VIAHENSFKDRHSTGNLTLLFSFPL